MIKIFIQYQIKKNLNFLFFLVLKPHSLVVQEKFLFGISKN